MARIEVISAISWFLILLFAQPIFFLLSFSNDLMDVFCLLTKKQNDTLQALVQVLQNFKTINPVPCPPFSH
jgi:hypothetical protein